MHLQYLRLLKQKTREVARLLKHEVARENELMGLVTRRLQVKGLREKRLKRELVEELLKAKKAVGKLKHDTVRELQKLKFAWVREFHKAFARESQLVLKLKRVAAELRKGLKQEMTHGMSRMIVEKSRQKKLMIS